MPVRDGGELVGQALVSILSQTFSDLEVIIVDDCSKDGTRDEVARVADDRVTVVRLDQPSGDLALALNEGIRHSRAELVARMDADDFSMPSRLEHQVATMTERPDLVLLGSWVEAVDSNGSPWMVSRPPCEDAAIRFILKYRCTFHHPAVMFSRAAFDSCGGYRTGYRYAEDFDLWRRMLPLGRLANLPEVLLSQRYHPQSSSAHNRPEQMEASDRIGVEMVSDAVGHLVSGEVARMLRDQEGPRRVRSVAAKTLIELYRNTPKSVAEDQAILRATVANELIDLASTKGRGRVSTSAFKIWGKAARVDTATTTSRAVANAREAAGWVSSLGRERS
jgi:glycosyltransferase involved in cell wall biosynthesis